MRSAELLLWAVPLGVLLAAPPSAQGQVWLSDKGDKVVSVSYQQLFSKYHLGSEGERFDKGEISSHGMNTGFEYGVSDRFTIDLNLLMTAAKHEGADRLHGPLDTGIYHGAIQDARVAFRYSLPQSPGGVTLTPYVGGLIPTHDYETRGHSAPGRHIPAFTLGLGAGRGLDPILPHAYVQGVYSYSIVERIGGMRNNRSNIEFEGGYSVTPRVNVNVAGAVQRTHGGILAPLPIHYHDHELQTLQPIHDRIMRADFFLMSAGVGVAVSRKVEINGSFLWTVSGANTHAVMGFVIGTAWRFSRGLTLGSS